MTEILNTPPFKHPFTMVISGSTGSGKTEWLMRFLNNLPDMIDDKISTVLYCYGETNENILRLDKIGKKNDTLFKIHNGIPTEEQIRIEKNLLLVLDDLMINLKNTFLDTIFTRGSHNWGVSVVLVTQNLFAKEIKTARNNSHYIVLMRNPAGELQMRNLAVQLFPLRSKYFIEAYKDATIEKFSYLLIDMHPQTEDNLRLKTHIYPGEITIVYISKENT